MQNTIFKSNAQILFTRRAQRRQNRFGHGLLLCRAIDDAASRISDINRNFKRACLIGPFDLRQAINAKLAEEKRIKIFDWRQSPDMSEPIKQDWQVQDSQVQDWQAIDSSPGNPPVNHPKGHKHSEDKTKEPSKTLAPYDLIINLLSLQSENDPPQQLKSMAAHLQPDGLLIAAVIGGQSLSQLRQSLYKVDQDVFGGAYARIMPMMDHHQAAALLGHAGLALPVIDSDRFTIAYSNLWRLVHDIRDFGQSNSLMSRQAKPLTRRYWRQLMENYQQYFCRDDGKYLCDYEIIWLCAWAPHDSQQKPLKPGSAKMHLSQAFKAQN